MNKGAVNQQNQVYDDKAAVVDFQCRKLSISKSRSPNTNSISKTRSPMTNQPLLIANVANCQLEEQDSWYLWLLVGKSDCWQRFIAPPSFLLILPSCIYPWNLSCATTKVCPRLQETRKSVLVQNKTRSHYTTACAAISRELANYSHFTHQTLSLPLWPEPRVNPAQQALNLVPHPLQETISCLKIHNCFKSTCFLQLEKNPSQPSWAVQPC